MCLFSLSLETQLILPSAKCFLLDHLFDLINLTSLLKPSPFVHATRLSIQDNMHSSLVRIQNTFGFFTSVAFSVAGLIAASVLFFPQTPSASISLRNAQV